ncbi:hypothetical protein BY996DRAFT_6488007 [Phakopsora pachyrhizi]|nr:hypothetical protein BY996DRAFT_6488007 [Phakopsora pachyrhizi]
MAGQAGSGHKKGDLGGWTGLTNNEIQSKAGLDILAGLAVWDKVGWDWLENEQNKSKSNLLLLYLSGLGMAGLGLGRDWLANEQNNSKQISIFIAIGTWDSWDEAEAGLSWAMQGLAGKQAKTIVI